MRGKLFLFVLMFCLAALSVGQAQNSHAVMGNAAVAASAAAIDGGAPMGAIPDAGGSMAASGMSVQPEAEAHSSGQKSAHCTYAYSQAVGRCQANSDLNEPGKNVWQ